MPHPRRARLTDLLLALALVAIAGIVGYRDMSVKFHCQNCIADLLYPCVRDFGRAPSPAALAEVPEYQAFWANKLTTIPCDVVAGLPLEPIGQYWDIQKYMHAGQSAVMLLTGPHFQGFWIFLGLMYGMTAAAAFALFRLGMGRVVAAAMTLALIYSPFQLHNLITPADYAKAPFALATLFVVGLLVKYRFSRAGLAAWSFAAGVLAGIGIGFKPDVLVWSAISLVALVLFVAPLVGDGRWRRATAAAAFLVAAVAVSGPILSSHFLSTAGSLFPVQILGGMARGHDDTHAAPSLYDYGVNFDDSWVTFQINSYNMRVLGATEFANFQNKELTKAATALVTHLDTVFPSDLVLRVIGAVIRVLGLAPLGLWAALLVVAALYATHLRWALFVTFVLFGFVGYVSLVFQSRHYFHLQFVGFWMLGFVVHHLVAAGIALARGRLAPEPAGTPVRGLAIMAAGLLLLVTVLVAARAYQQSQVLALLGGYDREESFVPVPAERREMPDGSKQLAAAWPIEEASRPESLALKSTYLVADVECLKPVDSEVTRAYESPAYWKHSYRVACSTGTRHWRLFLPIYESGARWRFKSIEWPAGDTITVGPLRKVADPRTTPLMLVLALPDNWRQQPFYHQLSWDAIRVPQPW